MVKRMIQTILKHDLEIIDIKDFKKYFKENESRFDAFAKKAFLKAVDIPPAYFLEQPESTKEILLDNKEDRINNLEKYIGKCIVVLWKDGMVLNACRMTREDAEMQLEQLSTIEDVEGLIWDKTFYKDGYIQGYIPVGDLKKDAYNKCVVVDFPILLNKPTVLHEAFFKMPNEKSIVERDLIYYSTTAEVDFNDYQHIALAVEDKVVEVKGNTEVTPLDENKDSFILREPEEVVCMLVEEKVIPKTIMSGVVGYIRTEMEGVQLTVNKLTEVLLSYEGNLKGIKQTTNLRGCYDFLRAEFSEELEKELA